MHYTQFERSKIDNPIITIFGIKSGNHHSQGTEKLDDREAIIREYTPGKEKKVITY